MGKAAKSGYGLQKVASERLDRRELRSASLFLFVLSIFFTACLCRPAPTHAQWASIGPDGGYILAVAVNPSNPNVVYAGSDGGGVFKSTNGGGNWALKDSGLTTNDIYSLAVDPSNPNIIYAGTDGGGVFKNTKSGLAACDLIENLDSEFEVEK